MKKRSFAAACLIVLTFSIAIFAASCGGGGGGDPAVNAIVSVDPADGATGVPVTRAISVVFNANLDETTLTAANVYLTRANGVVNVPGAITYDAATKTMTFTPNFPMVGGALYTFTITTGVHTKAAATNYTTTFTTVPALILYLSNYNPADPATPLTSYNLWSMNADGTGQTQLTTYTAGTSVSGYAPLWSPDYTKIAYGVAAGWEMTDPVNIYSMNADGTSPTALTSGAANYEAMNPVWLRNGSAILFMYTSDSTASPEIYDIASVGPTGTSLTNLTSSTATDNVVPDLPVDISPLGTNFVYSAGSMTAPFRVNLNIMNTDGTGHSTLTDVATNFTAFGLFSPDGTKVYYATQSATEAGGIYSINPDGTGVQTLATVPAGNVAVPLAVSPDGQRLVYGLGNIATSLTDLYILNITTATAVNITAAAGSNEAAMCAIWSPDGSRLAYIFGDDAAGPLDLYVVNADGTSPRNLTGYLAGSYVEGLGGPSFPGQWSPDGTQIVFTNHSGAGLIYNIAVADVDTSAVTPITSSTTTDYYFGDWW